MAVEAQAINYILEAKTVRGFKADWFTEFREHFDFINGFVNKYGKTPDKLTFVDKFKDFKCFTVEDPISSLVERLKEEARYKRVIPIYNKAYDLITNNKADEACKMLVEKIGQIDKALSPGLPPVDLTDLDTKKALFREHHLGVTKFPTGRPELDAQFGGWTSKDYVVLFARLGVGKSWVSQYFAYNLVKSGLRVGYYSGEMSAVEVSLRLDTFNTQESNARMFTGNMTEEDYSKVATAFSELPGKFFALTPAEIGDSASVEDIKRFIENNRLQAMFIDQISLMKRDNKLSTTEAIGKLANDLRVLQSLTGIPFFIVSQQHRQALQDKEAKTKDELMASISYSDALGQNATLAIYLDYDKESRKLTLNLVKNRRGAPQKFYYSWNIDKGDIRYIPVVEDEEVVEANGGEDYNDISPDPF